MAGCWTSWPARNATRRCASTRRPASSCAPAPPAAWPTRSGTTSRCSWSKRPGGPASKRERETHEASGEQNMSDDPDGWGGAEFVLAADRLDTPDVIEAADPGDMLRQGGPVGAPGPPSLAAWRGAR